MYELDKSFKQGVAEAGPFSYGKPPRKGSVADLAAKKRKEQERGQQPFEPKDQQVGVAKVTKGVAEMRDRRDAYQRDYDSSQTGFSRGHDHRGLEQELAHETNNIAIAINGKTWKVVPCKGTADSREERAYLNHMKDWAEKKSASSGKKWSVHLTGAPLTENADASTTSAANVSVGNAIYKNKPAKAAKNKDGTVKNAQDMDTNLITGGSIGKQSFIKR